MTLSVDVISDVICPWCLIGKRRLEKAIVSFGKPVTVRWHPFQLNPTMPVDGISRRKYRIGKFGSWERSMELDANIEATLNSDEGMDAIKEAGDHARWLQVEGVPFFVVNSEITLSGAQSPEVFLAAFKQAISST